MRRQRTEDIIKFLKGNVEPLNDNAYGPGYRASAYLDWRDIFTLRNISQSKGQFVNLAIRRFKEELSGKGVFNRAPGLGYYDIVKTFVTNGNCINDYDIDRAEKKQICVSIKHTKTNSRRNNNGLDWILQEEWKTENTLVSGQLFIGSFFKCPTAIP